MSKILTEVKHLMTVKRYRAKVPTYAVAGLAEDRILEEVEKLAGDETIWSVYNIAHYPSPSGEYFIAEWEVVCE